MPLSVHCRGPFALGGTVHGSAAGLSRSKLHLPRAKTTHKETLAYLLRPYESAYHNNSNVKWDF